VTDTSKYVIATPVETSVLDTEERSTDVTPPAPRPRVRWGAIVWGLVVTAITVTALTIRLDESRSFDFAHWVGGLTFMSLGLIMILVVGLFVLIVALLSVVKRAQVRRRARELELWAHQPVG